MEIHELSSHLSDILRNSKSVFLKTEPEVLDFTDPAPRKIHISSPNGRIEFEVNPQNIMPLMGLFGATIFDPERINSLYCWNIKSLISYVRHHISKFLIPKNSIIDLKPIEGFLGIRLESPKNYQEALDRIRLASRRGGWLQVYKSIHQPLFLKVLPAIETTALLNEQTRRPEYPCYEIEGQTNGRLNCRKAFSRCYLPQTMGPDVRRIMKPQGYDLRFAAADFRHCEVTVLQWLSNDERLLQILVSGEDLHRRIYEIVTEDKCDTEAKRDMSKKMFLPVMYGCGPRGLASNLKIPEGTARELIKRIRIHFLTAWNWMMEIQQQAKKSVVTDHFGRPRIFEKEKSYLARNFVVQAPAATICQEKLIQLYNAIDDGTKIAYSVHDGYALVTPVKKAKATYETIKKTLESESVLCPGLQMKVEVKFGVRLDKMKVLWK